MAGESSQSRPDEEGESRYGGLALIAVAAVLVLAGYWLVDALLAAKRADDCLASGRRSCLSQPVR